MKTFLLIISITSGVVFAQQNLIVNGSFEEYSSCPEDHGLPGNGEFEKAKGWWSPSYYSTPNYVNACDTGIWNPVGVPSNSWGYQEAFDGNGYVVYGMHSWYKNNGDFEGAEYIQTRLKEELSPCSTYHISFYISIAEASTTNIGYIEFGISPDSAFYCLGDGGANSCAYQPEMLEYWKIPVHLGQDTTSWYLCEMEFQPSYASDILTIGDFSLNFLDSVYIQESWSYPDLHFTFFYIDSVSLFKIGDVENCDYVDEIKLPNVFTPNNDLTNDYIDFSGFDKVIIMGRWGNTVLIMDSQSNFEWHGKNHMEEDVPAGIYYYVGYRGNQQQKGSVQLIR